MQGKKSSRASDASSFGARPLARITRLEYESTDAPRNSDGNNNLAAATEPLMTVEHRIDLSCHPSSRLGAVRAIQVLVRRSATTELQLTYRLEGDLPHIRIPPPGAPRIGTELWRHTCFEAFIALDGQPAYHEFNFSPSGEWCAYALSGYRNGTPVADEMMRPKIAVRFTSSRLELDALVRLDRLSAVHPRAVLRIGLSAVIEASDATLSYWAFRHPTDQPDFHNADSFALLLDPSRPE
jgi:hypothetical protein